MTYLKKYIKKIMIWCLKPIILYVTNEKNQFLENNIQVINEKNQFLENNLQVIYERNQFLESNLQVTNEKKQFLESNLQVTNEKNQFLESNLQVTNEKIRFLESNLQVTNEKIRFLESNLQVANEGIQYLENSLNYSLENQKKQNDYYYDLFYEIEDKLRRTNVNKKKYDYYLKLEDAEEKILCSYVLMFTKKEILESKYMDLTSDDSFNSNTVYLYNRGSSGLVLSKNELRVRDSSIDNFEDLSVKVSFNNIDVLNVDMNFIALSNKLDFNNSKPTMIIFDKSKSSDSTEENIDMYIEYLGYLKYAYTLRNVFYIEKNACTVI